MTVTEIMGIVNDKETRRGPGLMGVCSQLGFCDFDACTFQFILSLKFNF